MEQKYKLINKQTSEETLCTKVTIDGSDYYVSDETPPKFYEGFYFVHGKIFHTSKTLLQTGCKKVVATNNTSVRLDIPKVIDELEEITFNEFKSWSFGEDGPWHTYDTFKNGYNKSQSTHPNTDEDMILFLYFSDSYKSKHGYVSNEELLDLWKSQKPKIIYYE